jgi:hypothetical protein
MFIATVYATTILDITDVAVAVVAVVNYCYCDNSDDCLLCDMVYHIAMHAHSLSPSLFLCIIQFLHFVYTFHFFQLFRENKRNKKERGKQREYISIVIGSLRFHPSTLKDRCNNAQYLRTLVIDTHVEKNKRNYGYDVVICNFHS